MKRTAGVAGWAMLAALCALLGSARPAASLPPPNATPSFVRPNLFPGFEPIEPDELGISPSGEYFVFQDQHGFHVVRLFDGVETFQLSFVQNNLTVGFDPADERLFILEPLRGGDYLLRLVDPYSGLLLWTDRFSRRPTVRTNLDATVTVVVEADQRQSRAYILDRKGAIVYRRSYSSQLDFALNDTVPAVAFFDPVAGGNIRVEVVSAKKGLITFRETLPALGSFGFAPYGPAFVVARPQGAGTFRVRLTDVLKGNLLVSRSFSGPVNAGFTPDGTLLGVVARQGLREELTLFRTLDGSQVFTR